MDDFLDFLVKKTDIQNNEYFNYKQRETTRAKTTAVQNKAESVFTYLDEPTESSYCVLDFETTGGSPAVNKIIEIGAVKVIDGKAVDKFSTLVNPKQYIPYYISSKVHITNAMVSGAPTIDSVLPQLVNFIGSDTIIAHNARFDIGFLERNLLENNISMQNNVIDTLKMSRKYNSECERHNLAYLTNFFGIELKNAHRAYFDAYATHKLYEIIRKKFEQ
jgi:DNA polymerase-3 subunit alpha (Gram-positive type)